MMEPGIDRVLEAICSVPHFGVAMAYFDETEIASSMKPHVPSARALLNQNIQLDLACSNPLPPPRLMTVAASASMLADVADFLVVS